MPTLFKVLCILGLIAGFSAFALAANQTLTGTISDSMCGASHAKMAAAHPEAKMTDRDCTLACVKGGGKYVLVSNGKVYSISNQNLAALQAQAGRTVSVTGDVTGDSITVAKVTPQGGKKK